MFKLNAKFDADLLLSLLNHVECNGHTVHMLTQQHLPPPLTSTVKSSLFKHAHSSPLSLAAKLHQCGINCSHYIYSGWTFSGQTSYRVLYYRGLSHPLGVFTHSAVEKGSLLYTCLNLSRCSVN